MPPFSFAYLPSGYIHVPMVLRHIQGINNKSACPPDIVVDPQ